MEMTKNNQPSDTLKTVCCMDGIIRLHEHCEACPSAGECIRRLAAAAHEISRVQVHARLVGSKGV